MKKLKVISLITAFMALIAMPINAEVRVGFSMAGLIIDATGHEHQKDTGQISQAAEQSETWLPSFFAEFTMNGFGLGYDYVDETATIGKETRARTDEGSIVSNIAEAEIANHSVIYGIVPLGSEGAFLKVGVATADVTTKEVLGTGAVYGDATVDGVQIGLGYNYDFDSGLFLRASIEGTSYDELKLQGTADAVSGDFNTIRADLDTLAYKLSIGKAF